jgi:uncharacterized protein
VLGGFDRMAVAVSGGVDSMTLAHVAAARLGARAVMYHAVSPAVPPEATTRVRAHTARAGWRLAVIDAGEMEDPAYRANPVDRCFFCKMDLYGTIRGRTDWPIASGANLDDLGDYRPGLAAAARHGVRHPLIEAGLDKAAVRALAAELGLDDLAELPASPCLSSRIETGIEVTVDRLAVVLEAERWLQARLPRATVRCRVRRQGLVVEIDAASLEGIDRAEIAAGVGPIALRNGLPAAIGIAPYARGSAFLHGR